VGLSNIIVRNGHEIHIMWNRGVDGIKPGRYHAWSDDRGQSWSKPHVIMPFLGQTSKPLLAEDTAGVLHLVTIANNPGMTPLYINWNGKNWSDVQRLYFGSGTVQPSNVALTIALGNQLHVVYESPEYNNSLVHSKLLLDSPPIPSQSIISPQIPVPIVTTPISPAIKNIDQDPDTNSNNSPQPLVNHYNNSNALLISAVLVIFLLGVVVIIRIRN